MIEKDIDLNGLTIKQAIAELEWYKIKFGEDAVLLIFFNRYEDLSCVIRREENE